MSGIVGSRLNTRGSGLVGSVGTDGQVFTSAGPGLSNVFEDSAAGGVGTADSWRVNTTFQGTAAPITANWERSDGTGQGNVGDAFSSPSSGIFTFPSTGWWYIIFGGQTYRGGQDDRTCSINIDATVDNSTYTNISTSANCQLDAGSGSHQSSKCMALFDVTDTANCKVIFDIYPTRSDTYVNGDSNRDMLCAKFLRLTDT